MRIWIWKITNEGNIFSMFSSMAFIVDKKMTLEHIEFNESGKRQSLKFDRWEQDHSILGECPANLT